LDAEEAKIKSEIINLLEKLNKKAVTIEKLQITLSMLLEMFFKISSIFSSTSDVLTVLTMFSIANNPMQSL
jgi:hypothetical protein